MRKALLTLKVLPFTYVLLRIQPSIFKLLMLLGLWVNDLMLIAIHSGKKKERQEKLVDVKEAAAAEDLSLKLSSPWQL